MSDQPTTDPTTDTEAPIEPDASTTTAQAPDTPTTDTAAEDTPADDPKPQRDDDGRAGRANREAAKYRTRAKEAENALDTATTHLDAMRRQYVEMIAGRIGFDFDGDGGQGAGYSRPTRQNLRHPEDIFTMTGKTPTDFVGDDGAVSVQRVEEAARTLLADRPEIFERLEPSRPAHPVILPPDPSQGRSGGDSTEPASWSEVLRNRHR